MVDQRADALRKKALQTMIIEHNFVNKHFTDEFDRSSKAHQDKVNKKLTEIEKKSDKAYADYYHYIHGNYSKENINKSMSLTIKNKTKRKCKNVFMSRFFLENLKKEKVIKK